MNVTISDAMAGHGMSIKFNGDIGSIISESQNELWFCRDRGFHITKFGLAARAVKHRANNGSHVASKITDECGKHNVSLSEADEFYIDDYIVDSGVMKAQYIWSDAFDNITEIQFKRLVGPEG